MVELRTVSLGIRDWTAIALAAITGLLHLLVGARTAPAPAGVVLLLAGLGSLAWIALVLVGFHRHRLYLAAVPYAATLIVLPWALDGVAPADPLDPGLGVLDAAIQVALIVVLIDLLRQ